MIHFPFWRIDSVVNNSKRSSPISRACLNPSAGDAELRAEAESLLAYDGCSTADVRGIVADGAESVVAEVAERSFVGRRLGPYEVTKQIGAGGMGVVYRATRADGQFQEVAIKLVKRGMDTAAVVERFRNER